MKKIGWLCGVVCALLCLSACASPAYEAPELLEPVGAQQNIVQVRRGDICEMSSYEFAVVPEVMKVLYTVDGTLDDVCVVMGQTVKEGDIMLKMDVEAVQEQLDALNARISYTAEDNALTIRMLELDVAICESRMGDNRDYAYGTQKEQERLDEYERVKEALSQEEEREKLQMKQMYEERDELKKRIENSELKAPCAGQVVYIAQQPGESVRAGSAAVALAVDSLMLRGEYLSESVIDAADEITVLIGDQTYAVEYLPMEAEVYISLLLSGAEMNTDFAFAGGVPAAVKAGDYALLMVKTRLTEDVLYLPPNALESDAAGYYVYLVGENGGRERVNVKVGARLTTAVEVTEGLKEGDEVYVP